MHLLKSKNEDVNAQWQSKSEQKNIQRKSASASDRHKMPATPQFLRKQLKNDSINREFCPFFYTIALIGRLKAAPYKSSKWSCTKVRALCLKVNW